jgi:uncharacterized radical SAM superfamily Fe-S cluster-containing enzyme
MKTIRTTESVCPHCLGRAPATVYEKEGEVWMAKTCPEHGRFDVYLWPDVERYKWFYGHTFPRISREPQTERVHGCPRDCGLCPGHARRITLPEIEVSWRCNLACPVCFMSDDCVPPDPSLEEIARMVETIRDYDGPGFPLQITGGEPTIRTDLPGIIEMAVNLGAEAVELNTNGLIIGSDIQYLRALKEAGLTNVYLQFDGLDPETTKALRGRDVLWDKLRAIENCRREKIPVMLSVTLVAGVNDWELGGLIRFAWNNLDVIGGLALQPAFVSGRFEIERPRRLGVLDVARLIERQTGGRIRETDFWPVGSSHPLCYGSTYLLPEKGGFVPSTRHLTEEEYRRNFCASSPQGAVFMDLAANGALSRPPAPGLPILIMEYMDAWTMDLERARECNLAVSLSEGTSIPFCVYHLCDSRGQRLYPHGGRGRHVTRA